MGLLLLFVIMVVSCQFKEFSPLELAEISTTVPDSMPVYYFGEGHLANDMDIAYYYNDLDDELHLVTYFINGRENSRTPIARMSTSSFMNSNTIVNEAIDGTIIIEWAKEKIGYRCNTATLVDDIYPDVIYQTCFYWIDQETWFYEMYSVWPEEDAVNLINNLSKLTR